MEVVKKKSANFSKQEIEVLISEVESKKDILFAKFGPGITSDVKSEGWADVAMKVNSVSGGNMRTEKMVKKKYTDMCSQLRMKESARRRDMSSTGGGSSTPYDMSQTEIKLLQLLAPESIEGVAGGCDVGFTPMSTDETQDSAMATVSATGNVVDVTVHQENSVKRKQVNVKKQNDGGMDELMGIEKKRLQVEEERLEVEKKRLAVEERRLELELERWQLEKNRLLVLVADE